LKAVKGKAIIGKQRSKTTYSIHLSKITPLAEIKRMALK
jgi:hypothetical protein